jgi:hypothetical protein
VKLLLIFILLSILSVNTCAETREWATEEKLWGATAGALLAADWATTRNMTHRYNEGYYERNPLLGSHPTANRVNLYFLTVAPAIFFAADYFGDYRKEILQAVSAVELIVVGNNLRLGLHFQF